MQHQRTSRTRAAHNILLGRAVRELRAVRVLSQEELGFRARLHRNYIGAIERGEINPTFKTLMTLADGLDVELSALIRLYERHCEEPPPDVATRPTSTGGRVAILQRESLRSSCR